MKETIISRCAFFLFFATLTSCSSICLTKPVEVKTSERLVTFKESSLPCYKTKEFEKAARYAIEAIYSDEFLLALASHIENGIGTGTHAGAWNGVSAKNTVRRMRENVDGMYAQSYGGIKGLWLFVIFDNVAYDGNQNGPIKLNRWGLKQRSVGSIANTIAHELAHKIGLVHPGIEISRKIASKEPPYVVGDMIERIVDERIKSEQAHGDRFATRSVAPLHR